MNANRVLIGVLVCLCAGLPTRASAQVPQPSSELLPRPYRGVYGGNSANGAGISHSFETTLSLWGGNDHNTGNQGFADPEQAIGGPYSAGGLAFSYAWRSPKLSFGANASTQPRYYADLDEFLSGIQTAGAGVEASLGPKTRIQAQQTFAFTPLFAVNPFPVLGQPDLGEIVPPNADYTLAQRDTMTLGSTAGFSHELGARSTIGAGYVYNSTQYSEGFTDLRSHTAVLRWDHRVGRNGLLAALYSFRDGQYELNATAAPVRTQEAAIELGRQWVHSRTRRTTLRASAGGTIVDAEGSRETRPVGGVQFSSLVGESWDIQGSYRRGVDFIPGLADVSYVDGLGFSISGLLAPRVDAMVSASYATGDVGISNVRNRYTAYTGLGRLGFAVHRKAAIFSEVFYYSAEYGNPVSDPTIPAPGQDQKRFGFRAGMSWWLPIVRERQSRDTR